MLKEQLLGLAMKAIAQAYKTKERIKENLTKDKVKDYVQTIKQMTNLVVEDKNKSTPVRSKTVTKTRKSSIKPVRDISSQSADQIVAMLKSDSSRLLTAKDEVDGKKSLAYLLWALGHAERANISQGISVHDVSALLYRACKIELYPINISRVVHTPLVKQLQKNRTKTYMLTAKGQSIFKEKFL